MLFSRHLLEFVAADGLIPIERQTVLGFARYAQHRNREGLEFYACQLPGNWPRGERLIYNRSPDFEQRRNGQDNRDQRDKVEPTQARVYRRE